MLDFALVDQRLCVLAGLIARCPPLDGSLRRDVRGAFAQVDSYLPIEHLLALPRPQVFEPLCCDDPFTGGTIGAAFVLIADKFNTSG